MIDRRLLDETKTIIMIKEKYKQLCLPLQFGKIDTIGFTQTLPNIIKETAV